MVARRTKGVESARRALQMLLKFTENKPALTADELLEAYQISLPTAYRYLSLLREMHLIEERSKGTFVLSPRIFQLAHAAEATLDYRVEAQPVLDRLTEGTEETSLYMRQINDAAVCLAIAETDRAISISFLPGHRMPLNAGAGAKLLLAEYSATKRNQYLDRLEPPLSKTARAQLISELDRMLIDNYAESRGEVDDDVWACAAPIRAHGIQVGVISVVAPAYRVSVDKQKSIGRAVSDAAAELEQVLAQLR